jgi:5-methyltetrahydropteroyltriglutamate--homocysteine methyltransferase
MDPLGDDTIRLRHLRHPAVLATLEHKTVILGVLDLDEHSVETADVVAQRVRRVLLFVDPGRIVLAPDCGTKYLPRASAEGKLRAMTEAARLLRTEAGA